MLEWDLAVPVSTSKGFNKKQRLIAVPNVVDIFFNNHKLCPVIKTTMNAGMPFIINYRHHPVVGERVY